MKPVKLFIFLSCFFLLPAARAGGPWFVNETEGNGIPARWPYDEAQGKWIMHWRIDPGPFFQRGRQEISSDQGRRDWIEPMLNEWKNVTIPLRDREDPVPTAAIDYVPDGAVEGAGGDINTTNYLDYIERDLVGPPKTTVIFDIDGTITRDFCLNVEEKSESECTEAQNRRMGQANLFLDDTTQWILGGYIIINTHWINQAMDANYSFETASAQFKATILHEFAHLWNLDHSQVNRDLIQACIDGNCAAAQAIPTMFPQNFSPEQYTLHRDDKVAISWLYPNDTFKNEFCCIVGEVQNEAGKGIQGINVVASNKAEPEIDARSMVSGVRYPYGEAKGDYALCGIRPGKEYEVIFEPLLETYVRRPGSSFQPLETASPLGFTPGKIKGPDGTTTVRCESGGRNVQMKTLKLAVAENRLISGGIALSEEEEEEKKDGKKGWFCQLNPGQNFLDGSWIFLGWLALCLILLGWRIHWRRV